MNGLARHLANRLVSVTAYLLPVHHAPWSHAMAREIVEIPHDRAALGFAVGCLRAAVTLALFAWLTAKRRHFMQLFSSLSGRAHSMKNLLDHPRLLGLLCGSGAVGLGLAYMVTGGAPTSYLLVNFAALLLGTTAWIITGRATDLRFTANGRAVFALALLLLATAVFGVAAAGASRWVSVGALNVQVSLIVLPVMIVLYTRNADLIGTVGVVIAAVSLATQPDRAMAGMLAAGLAGLVLSKPGRLPMLALAITAVAFVVTLIRPDASPAMPFVDRILYSAFDVHAFAGLAVVAGCFLLIVPALVGVTRRKDQRVVLLAFGASWSGAIAAAALGNYPTPLVGYSGSAVLGYLLSVALLPSGIQETADARAARTGPAPDRKADDDAFRPGSLKLA